MPASESTELTQSRFVHTAGNAFRQFVEEVSPGSTNVSLETPGARLSIERKPSGTVYTLTSPSGELVIERSPAGVRETVTTPSGTLIREKQGGAITESFTGTDREKVEEAARELRELMRQKKSRIDELNQDARAQLRPDIALEVTPDGPEKVRLTNSGTREVNLDGWRIEDAEDAAYTFPAVKLSPGEELVLYTGDGEDTGSELYWGTSTVWNNGGDTATLYDSSGDRIARESY